MKWFLDKDWAWNGLRRPYKILEKHPDELFINPHFSVNFKNLIKNMKSLVYMLIFKDVPDTNNLTFHKKKKLHQD